MNYKKFQVYFFIVALISSVLLTVLVFQPYLILLAFSGVLALLFRPIYRYFFSSLKSPSLAALLTVIIIALTIILPLVYFFAALYNELIIVFSNVKTYFDPSSFETFLAHRLPDSFRNQIPGMMDGTIRIIRGIGDTLTANLFAFFSNVVSIIFGFFILLFSVYYLLKDGAYLKKEIIALSPLRDEYDELLFEKMTVAVRAVMGGVLIVGLIKGLLTALAFLILRIPAPLFWGLMTGLSSLIPLFGVSLILVPAILYLFVIGHYGSAIVLVIISVGLIGTVDNYLQPKLVQSKTKIHPLLILLSVLGGFQFYQFAGFVLGPLTLAIAMAFLDIYKREFKNYIATVE